MGTGDWFETLIFIGLTGLALASGRADFFIIYFLMLTNHIWCRVGIAFLDPLESVAFAAAFQFALNLLFAVRASGVAGEVIGSLFGIMVIAAGVTVIGALSPDTSAGLTSNYWTVMSVAAFAQDCVLVAAFFMAGNLWRV